MVTSCRCRLTQWQLGGASLAPEISCCPSTPFNSSTPNQPCTYTTYNKMAPAVPDGVAIQPHKTKGRALHTTKTVAAGDVLAVFTPLLLLPSLSHLASVCSFCLRAGTPRPCSRCRAAYYCDARCQAAAWSAGGHSLECAALVRAVPSSKKRRAIPTPVRALVRVLLSRDGKEADLGTGMEALEGHVEQRRRAPGWADMEMMAMGGCAFAGQATSEENVRHAVEILCKVGSMLILKVIEKGTNATTAPNKRLSQVRRRPGARRHLPRADAGHGQSLLHPQRLCAIRRANSRVASRVPHSKRRRD